MQSDPPAAETTAGPGAGGSQAPPAEGAAVPTAQAAASETPQVSAGGEFWGTGRRKCAVARVRLRPGGGQILINRRGVEDYFKEPQEQLAVRAPLLATNTESSFDVHVTVRGGGHRGQADAVLLGIARALVRADRRHESPLREKGYLTRDARVVERKKYGRRKARRRFQFSKR